MLLDDWDNRGDAENDAENHVEADEKFVKPAVSSVRSSVVSKAQTNGNQTHDVKENRG